MQSLMSMLTLDPGKLLPYLEENWSRVCVSACREVRKCVRSGRYSGDRPPSLDLLTPKSLGAAFESCGFVLVGGWQDPDNFRKDKLQGILIHWPTLTRIAPHLPYSALNLRSFCAMYWGMADVLRRRSVLYHNLLFRKYLGVYRSPAGSGTTGWKALPPLDKFQADILDILEPLSVKDARLWRAFSSVFRDTMQSCAHMPPSVETEFRGMVREDQWHEFSYFRIGKYLENYKHLPPSPDTDNVKGSDFTGSKVSPELEELLVLRHLPPQYSKRTGVLFDTEIHSERHMRVINMRLYSRLRRQMGSTFYSNVCKQLGYKVSPDTDVGDYAAEFVQHFEDKYEEFKLPLFIAGDYDAFIAQKWPGAPDIRGCLFVPIPSLDKRIQTSRKLELIRPTLTRKKAIAMAERRNRQPKRSPREFAIQSPPIDAADGMRFKLYVIRVRQKVYFYVPWEMPTQYRTKAPRNPENPTPATGARIHPETGKWYFTLACLLTDPSSPLYKYPALHEWMRAYSRLTPARFNKLNKEAQRLHVDVAKRSTQGIGRERFKADEDAAIVRLYRPEMTETDKEAILRACAGRQWHAIIVRANTLRNKMIESGIYSLERLPHRNYNAALKRKLAQYVR
ncbi:MAG: hypothetical protein DRJ03_17700 [Chloroflexi bacterium]|nr:MAG: hypothetical protein DRJ03_17700 [Chloroflexota bacterium]